MGGAYLRTIVRMLGSVAVAPALAGCAGEPEAPGFGWRAELATVYCYRTLAEPDCYLGPVPGAEGRLIAAGPEFVFTWVPPLASAHPWKSP